MQMAGTRSVNAKKKRSHAVAQSLPTGDSDFMKDIREASSWIAAAGSLIPPDPRYDHLICPPLSPPLSPVQVQPSKPPFLSLPPRVAVVEPWDRSDPAKQCKSKDTDAVAGRTESAMSPWKGRQGSPLTSLLTDEETVTSADEPTNELRCITEEKHSELAEALHSQSSDSNSSTASTDCTMQLQTEHLIISNLGRKSQLQLESDADAKQKRINQVFMNLKIAEKVGVCFMVDCTGSMGPWINEIKKKIKSWSEQLHANHTGLKLHLAFVRYTDYDHPPSTRTTILDFTMDIQEFYRFVDGIRAEGGQDEAEDVFGGLEAMLKLNWQKVGTKVLIHIADAPCHGAQYHDSDVSDDYPKGDPGGLKLDDLMKQLADKQIAYHFGYIKKSRTLAMIKAFNSSLLVQSHRLFSIQQFDSRQTNDLTENVFRTITISISATCEVLTAEANRKLHDFVIDEKEPCWDDFPIQQVLVTPPPQPGAIAMLEHPKTPMSVKIAPEPFGIGNQRIAYHGLDITHNSHIVIKRSKWTDERSNCMKRCLETANVHAIAAKFSAQFNEEKPLMVSSSEIRFIPVGVMQIKDNGQEQNFTYETYLGCSEFTKFNSNFAYVPESKDHTLNATCQAFSHYTWVRSGKQLVVCDLQGKKVGSNVILTDPAIHDSVSVLHHGTTNLGEKGIERFFQLHKCNDICRAMQLERPHSE